MFFLPKVTGHGSWSFMNIFLQEIAPVKEKNISNPAPVKNGLRKNSSLLSLTEYLPALCNGLRNGRQGASDYGSEGWGFESLRDHFAEMQILTPLLTELMTSSDAGLSSRTI